MRGEARITSDVAIKAVEGFFFGQRKAWGMRCPWYSLVFVVTSHEKHGQIPWRSPAQKKKMTSTPIFCCFPFFFLSFVGNRFK